MLCTPDSERQGKGPGEKRGSYRQEKRVSGTNPHERADGTVVGKGIAKVPVQDRSYPTRIALWQRSIDFILRPHDIENDSAASRFQGGVSLFEETDVVGS